MTIKCFAVAIEAIMTAGAATIEENADYYLYRDSSETENPYCLSRSDMETYYDDDLSLVMIIDNTKDV